MRFLRTLKYPKFMFVFMMLAAGLGGPALSQAVPLQPGQAVATCYSGSNSGNYSVGVLDIRSPTTNAPGVNMNWPNIGADHWRVDSEVFGIALDDASPPNIYVTATTCYNTTWPTIINVPGDGNVYKINGVTGLVSVFITLPNDTSGLGNIAYDGINDQFFVTNFHDGYIYRIPRGAPLTFTTYDPGPSYNASLTVNDFVPLGDRPWGIGVYKNRVYFSMWSEDEGRIGNPNSIHSVALGPSGGFVPSSEVTEIDPITPNAFGWSMPVSDIAFSSGGRMLLGERGMRADEDTRPHRARVLEYVRVNTAWIPTANLFEVGPSGIDASGGVDYICSDEKPELVVATADALHFGTGNYIYGLQIFPDTGGSIANSYLVDIDNDIVSPDKRLIGDVEVYNDCNPPCLEIIDSELLCTTDGNFIWKFRVKNISNFNAQHLFLIDLPSNVTASPAYLPLGNLPTPCGTSGYQQVLLQVSGPTSGLLSFRFAMHNEDLSLCCFADYDLMLPDCTCAQALEKRVTFGPSGYEFTFTLQNLATTQVSYILTVPVTTGITLSQSYAPLSSPMGYWDTEQVTVGISGPGAVAGAEICLRISTHDADFRECCSIVCCIKLPPSCLPPWCYLDRFDIETLGEASTSSGDFGLLTKDMGDDGQGGIKLTPQDGVIGIDLAWADLDKTVPEGAFLDFNTTGTVAGQDRSLGRLRITDVGPNLEINADYSTVGSETQRLRFYRDGRLVHEVSGYTGSVTGALDWPTECGKTKVLLDGSATACYYPKWRDLETFQLKDGKTIEAHNLQILAESPEAPVESVNSFAIRAASIPSILIHSATVSLDCNENAIPDDQEITRGLVSDANHNGVPDSCENLVLGHAFNLNTGYDQANGVSLRRPNRGWVRILAVSNGLEGPD